MKFGTSLPMSSYLACFIICDFDHLESVFTSKGFPITVYARRDHVNELNFARHVALIAANYYIDYFNIDYPLPKLGEFLVSLIYSTAYLRIVLQRLFHLQIS